MIGNLVMMINAKFGNSFDMLICTEDIPNTLDFKYEFQLT